MLNICETWTQKCSNFSVGLGEVDGGGGVAHAGESFQEQSGSSSQFFFIASQAGRTFQDLPY